MNSFDYFLQRLGGLTCGRLLIWSVAINAVLATVLFITVANWPDDGQNVTAKAAQLLHSSKGGAISINKSHLSRPEAR